MLPRPKPGESESDLLKFQNQFLASKASPAVKVVKKADKRRGDGGSGVERLPLQHDRDVVSLDGKLISDFFTPCRYSSSVVHKY